MALSTATNRAQYNGTGAQTAFVTPPYYAQADLKVYEVIAGILTLRTLTTHYTVSPTSNVDGAPATGTVTFVTAPASGTGNVLIFNEPPLTQLTDLAEASAFPANTIEKMDDLQSMVSITHDEKIGRSIKLPRECTLTNVDIPNPQTAANQDKFLYLTSTGVAVAVPATSNFVDPLTTKGDLFGQDASAHIRVPVAADGAIFISLAAENSGRSNLLVGTNEHMLVSDSAATEKLGWRLPYFHGQCRLTKSGATLLLSQWHGNKLLINSALVTVPDAGVTLAASGVAADTSYYIYAYMVSTTMTLEFSATAPAVQAVTGVVIKTADATRTLVGMARSTSGSAWADTVAQRYVISYFNRRNIAGQASFTANRTTGSTTYVELNAEIRCEFLTWGDEAVLLAATGTCSNGNATDNCGSSLSIDGGAVENVMNQGTSNSAGEFSSIGLVLSKSGLAEGYHNLSLHGKVSANTGTWLGSATAGARCATSVEIRG